MVAFKPPTAVIIWRRLTRQ